MGQEDLAQLDQPDAGAQELTLRSLPAVEEEALSPAPDEQRGRPPLRGGHRRRGAEEDDVEIHSFPGPSRSTKGGGSRRERNFARRRGRGAPGRWWSSSRAGDSRRARFARTASTPSSPCAADM